VYRAYNDDDDDDYDYDAGPGDYDDTEIDVEPSATKQRVGISYTATTTCGPCDGCSTAGSPAPHAPTFVTATISFPGVTTSDDEDVDYGTEHDVLLSFPRAPTFSEMWITAATSSSLW
jgi:hypothetical protein